MPLSHTQSSFLDILRFATLLCFLTPTRPRFKCGFLGPACFVGCAGCFSVVSQLRVSPCIFWFVWTGTQQTVTFQVSLPDGFLFGSSRGRIGRRWKGGRRGNGTFFLISAPTSILPGAKNSGSCGFQLLSALSAPDASWPLKSVSSSQLCLLVVRRLVLQGSHPQLPVSLSGVHTPARGPPAGSLSSSQVGSLKP